MRNWIASLDPKTGNMNWKTYSIPAPGEPGSETWKDKNNAWQTGGGAFYVTGSYDPADQPDLLGLGQSGAGLRSAYRPGDNLYTNSAIAFDAATGKIAWYIQYTPNDNHDYDETGTHILIDTKINGEDRKIVSHAGRNGFKYIFDRLQRPIPQGRPVRRQGDLDQGHRSEDRQAGRLRSARDVQIYAEPANVNDDKVTRGVVPRHMPAATTIGRRPTAQRPSWSTFPGNEGCADVTPDYTSHVKGKFAGGTRQSRNA